MAVGKPITRDSVLAARAAIGGRLHRTPLLSSATLGRSVRGAVFLKAELFQRTGSFKVRGVLTKLAALSPEERSRGVIGVSAGNHAQALAYGSALEGIDCLVVMWSSASRAKLAAAREYGAGVDLEAEGPGDAFRRLHELQEATGRVFVSPFDDPLVIAGQGTVGLELLEDAPRVDTVVVPVGGGGLVTGIAVAAAVGSAPPRVVGVEPELAPALTHALEAGRPVPVEPRSLADGLNAPFAGELCVDLCRELGVETVLVTEGELATGFRFLYERAKLACEPAGAAGVAALLAGKVPLDHGETAVAVVSGGNVAADTAAAILAGR